MIIRSGGAVLIQAQIGDGQGGGQVPAKAGVRKGILAGIGPRFGLGEAQEGVVVGRATCKKRVNVRPKFIN